MLCLKIVAPWLLGILALTLYVNGLPRLFSFDVVHWFAYWIGFFVLAASIARFFVK